MHLSMQQQRRRHTAEGRQGSGKGGGRSDPSCKLQPPLPQMPLPKVRGQRNSAALLR